MAMNIINYKGLHKRKNYEQLLDYLQNNQDMIRYPDRFANQMRNHPYLTQFDSDEFGLMQDQQKEIKKQEVIKATMMDEATQTNGVSTTDLLARAPLRQPPTGFGSHLDTSGGGLNSGGPRSSIGVRPRNYGDDEVEMPSIRSVLSNGGPNGLSSIQPYAYQIRQDEIEMPRTIDRVIEMPRTIDRVIEPSTSTITRKMSKGSGGDMSIDSPTTGTLLDRVNGILQTEGEIMQINGPSIVNRISPINDLVGVPRRLRSVLETEALPDVLTPLNIYPESFRSISHPDVEVSDFESILSDFMYAVVGRHDEQRSSVSEGSFHETPAFLKPETEQERMQENDKQSEDLRNANKIKDKYLNLIRNAELTMFDNEKQLEKVYESKERRQMAEADKESSKFKNQSELNENSKRLTKMPFYEAFKRGDDFDKVTKQFTLIDLKEGMAQRGPLDNEIFNKARSEVKGPLTSKANIARFIINFDIAYKQKHGLYSKDFEKTYKVDKQLFVKSSSSGNAKKRGRAPDQNAI